MIALARTHPDKLGLPFGHWSLDRLIEHLHQTEHIYVSRASWRGFFKPKACAGIKRRAISPSDLTPSLWKKGGNSQLLYPATCPNPCALFR